MEDQLSWDVVNDGEVGRQEADVCQMHVHVMSHLIPRVYINMCMHNLHVCVMCAYNLQCLETLSGGTLEWCLGCGWHAPPLVGAVQTVPFPSED